MEITRHNFTDLKPILTEAINSCDFISIDTEFTGLELPGGEQCSLFDGPAKRYSRYREVVQAYTLAQVGVACFTKDRTKNKYEAAVFNIYVFPCAAGNHNSMFASQCSSLNFLRRNGFDFNKFICDGVQFLSRNLTNQVAQELSAGSVGINDVDKQYLQDTCQILTEWLALADDGQTNEIDMTPVGIGSERWVFVYEILRRFPQIWIVSENAVKLTLEKHPVAKNAIWRHGKRQQLLDMIMEDFTGCAVLFEMIKNSKKPLIGHNMLLDLMFMYEKFHDVLPEKYEDFKSQLNQELSEIYDTKFIVSWFRAQLTERGCKSFGLSGLYKFLDQDPNTKYATALFQPLVALSRDSSKYEDGGFFHEAGFDAYVSGIVFLRLAHMVAMSTKLNSKTEPLQFEEHMAAVKPHVNRLNLINAAVAYMSLTGDDPISVRPDWLVASTRGMFQRLDRAHLVSQLSKFGAFDLKHLSSSQALVAFAVHNNVKTVIEAFKNNKDYVIMPFATRPMRANKFLLTGALIVFCLGVCAAAAKVV